MPDEEMANLMRSLSEWGMVQPVVARREDNLILGGHQRCEAMRRLLADQGDDPATFMVPVIFLDGIDDARAKVLTIALNRIHGEWDYEKLSDLFMSIEQDAPDLDPMLAGFSEKEMADITNLMSDAPIPVAVTSDEDIEEGLAAQGRKFVFLLPSDEEAAMAKEVLTRFGMTGPGNSAAAFTAVCRAAEANIKPIAEAQAGLEMTPIESSKGRQKKPKKEMEDPQ
jgi:hypothetical protein